VSAQSLRSHSFFSVAQAMCFKLLLAVLVAASVGGQTPPSPPPSYRFTSAADAVGIPAEVIADGLVLMQAKVNGRPGWFILDNASQGFTVDREFARQILLKKSGAATARGGGSDTIQADVIRDVEIGLSGLDLTHRVLIAIDLKGVEPSIGHTVDGIIGSRLFDDFVVAVDYAHRTISIFAPGRYKPPADATPLPVRVDEHGFPFIDATITLPGVGPVVGSFLIDGGANTYADLYKPFSDAHHIPPVSMKLLDEPGTSTGGRTASRDGRADRVVVGPFSVANAPITFAGDVEGLLAAKDYAGLVGAEFLERFDVVFDNPDKRIWLTPNATYEQAADYDGSGLRIGAEGPGFHRFVVRRTLLESPAADAGIVPGDIVESIDNRSTEAITLTEIRNMLRRPGGRYWIGILRGDRHLRVALQLRKLI
jgi:PDZ domain/Aspartyl protease